MSKKKKTEEKEITEATLYYFRNVHHDGDITYMPGVGYELTDDQIKTYIKVVEIGTCPKISKMEDCGCN